MLVPMRGRRGTYELTVLPRRCRNTATHLVLMLDAPAAWPGGR
ncbi:hypothetical protein I551_8803 [Mycobacterium ulcerans str. Harvey]|uniref:Transposase n=1 Tax=Mycobacterium ulcerans str. Harvey TaxID=1299332 RepID=A0ABN0R9S7_MYCUL|nr:hypothetical protein I551_8803 [Mycobacterium ulcerans str. Harvey]